MNQPTSKTGLAGWVVLASAASVVLVHFLTWIDKFEWLGAVFAILAGVGLVVAHLSQPERWGELFGQFLQFCKFPRHLRRSPKLNSPPLFGSSPEA